MRAFSTMRLASRLLLLMVPASLFGQDIPNWTVPPYRSGRTSGGLSTMTDISPGVGFVAMRPCRVFDTRNANGPYGGPRLVANATRNFDIDSGPCTGIPAGVEAYSMNFGAILADGIGFVTIWPTGVAQPTVSSINTIPGYVLANAAIVPAGTGGAISVLPNTGLHLYGDINGYFTVVYNPGNQFVAAATVDGGAALIGQNNSAAAGSHGLGGFVGGAGIVFGVQGQAGGGALDESAGVRGIAPSGGTTYHPGFSSGVLGVAGAGEAFHVGVIGISGFRGVEGLSVASNGINIDAYGVVGTGNLAFFGDGNLAVTGMKSFVDPHPTDPSKVIRYVSLEGPEAGTYFRGKGKFDRGIARIPIPEDFRLVTDPEGLSVQVTPIGAMATVAVMKVDLNEIVLQASRNVEFFYTVNGVRQAFKSYTPMVENDQFVPLSARSRMIGAWSPEQKRRLIQNGTYNEDGTVNVETARRLGWDEHWRTDTRPTPGSD
jgi:hypothetical protein